MHELEDWGNNHLLPLAHVINISLLILHWLIVHGCVLFSATKDVRKFHQNIFFTLSRKEGTVCNWPFAAGGHMVQNPKYRRAKECDKTPLGNVNKEILRFSS